MSWLILILIATGLFAWVNIIDKFLCGYKFKNTYALAIATNLSGWLFLLFLLPLVNFSNFYGLSLLWAIVSGPVYLLMWLFFWKALELGEVSRIAAVFNIRPIFTSLLSIFLLGEVLNLQKWAAILIIVSGAFLISWERKKPEDSRFNISYLFVILASLAAAAGDILSKFALVKISPFGVYFWSALATTPLLLLFLRSRMIRDELRLNFKDKQSFWTLLLRGLISVVAVCFFYLALGSGPASLVVTVQGSSPMVVFLYVLLVSRFWPKFLKENITPRIILQKSLAILLIVSGVILINF